MDKIESNAIKILDLLGYKQSRVQHVLIRDSLQYNRRNLIGLYSSYNGLMQIIESEISEYELKNVHFELENTGLLEAVQKYVIRYLELKNGL
jgi:hypothetical protein